MTIPEITLPELIAYAKNNSMSLDHAVSLEENPDVKYVTNIPEKFVGE